MTAGLLAGVIAASNAQSFTVYTDNTLPPANDWTAGANTSSGDLYTNVFLPNGAGAPVLYMAPTVVKFGDTQTFGPTTGSGTYSNVPVEFTFDVANGDTTGSMNPSGPPTSNNFLVIGHLDGGVSNGTGGPQSTTHVTFTSLEDVTTGVTDTTLATNPNNGLQSLVLSNVMLDGHPFTIYLNDVQDIAAPGTQTTSITGYVISGTSVPEPGVSVSMACMVMGTFLVGLRARRRSKK
jgi:hypothetical protein